MTTHKKELYAKQASTLYLRAVILTMGAVVLAVCIFALPAGIASDDSGPYLPVLFGLYAAALPFFFALHQTLKLLNYIDRNLAFSSRSTTALQKIMYSALVVAGLFTTYMPFIYSAAQNEDAPGLIVMGLFVIMVSLAIAVFARVMQRLLQNAMDLKSENDLTV